MLKIKQIRPAAQAQGLARHLPKSVCPHCRDAKQRVEFTFFYLVRARNNPPEILRGNMALTEVTEQAGC